ncbi:dentin sialophosphoprotein-like, partial [Trifolium medium]|nr:dentin sialophosphoprotein-like [Trifolium medium]
MSKSSSFNKFAGVGRTGKENSHSVWQKVQKNSSSECGSGDLKKINTASSQFVSVTEKVTSAIKNCNSVGSNVVSGPEDKKHVKNKVGRKSKGKSDLIPKKGPCSYSRKGSNLNRTVLNDNMKASIQQNDSSNISSQEMNQQGSVMEFQTNGVEQETSGIVHSEQLHPEESEIQK